MSGLLMDACCSSLSSSYSHLPNHLDWHQHRPGISIVSVSPSRTRVNDLRTASDSRIQTLKKASSGHDPVFCFGENHQPLPPLQRKPSPSIATLKREREDDDLQVDDAVMGGNGQRSKKQATLRRPNPPKQEARDDASGVQPEASTVSPSAASSAKSVPPPQLTFTGATTQSDEGSLEEEEEEEEDLSGTPSDGEEDSPSGSTAKTAAERLAEKRKMKRFRLTHSQTRFLMSEFSRQPHPDAAQRERLSRDIPGLSPRQVQVWFQNRRAKMKRLTGDDQERMMRSRALPAGFDFSRTLRPSSSDPSKTPSTLAHFAGPSTAVAGGTPAAGSAIGESAGRSERRDIAPINIASVYGNPSYSLNTAGGSSNVSPSTSLQSANQSPLFTGSPTSSPFLRSGTEQFPRTFNPTNLGFPSQGNFRARSGSLMSLSHSSLSGGSPLAHPRASVSAENMQAMYQTQQYEGSNPEDPTLEPQLSDMANLQMHSPSLFPSPEYHGPAEGLRRGSSSTMSSAMAGSSIEHGFEASGWFSFSSHEQIPDTGYHHLQMHQVRRRQTQPSTHPTPPHHHQQQQQQASGMPTLSPTGQSQRPFNPSIYQQQAAGQSPPPPPLQQMTTPYATMTTSFPTDTREFQQQQQQQASYGVPPGQASHVQSPASDHLSPTEIYHSPQQMQQQGQQGHQRGQEYPPQGPGYTGYYQPPPS